MEKSQNVGTKSAFTSYNFSKKLDKLDGHLCKVGDELIRREKESRKIK